MKAVLQQALDALENSVDLVEEEHTDAVLRYGRYPSRQGKLAGLKALADAHQAAIVAIKQALAQERKPLTDKQLDAIWMREIPLVATGTEWRRSIARAIEAAHGIKEQQ